jgi:Rieske Fe-S protein
MKRRRALTILTFVFAAFGIGAIAVPFIQSMNPTSAAYQNYIKEIDISLLQPGEYILENWFTDKVLVYRRTQDQIAWLKTYKPPLPVEQIKKDFQGLDANYTFRSNKEEYFVAILHGNGKNILLREITLYYSCDEFLGFQGETKVTNGLVFNGGFYCRKSYGYESQINDTWMVYDVSGRPADNWVTPLKTPTYEIESGKVTVSPTKSQSNPLY